MIQPGSADGNMLSMSPKCKPTTPGLASDIQLRYGVASRSALPQLLQSDYVTNLGEPRSTDSSLSMKELPVYVTRVNPFGLLGYFKLFEPR